MLQLLLFIASALIGSGVLFHHKRVLTYIALAGALFEAEMLLTTFLHRTILSSVPGPTFFLVAGIIFTTLWIAFYKSWKSPYSVPGSGKRDGFVAVALLFVYATAYPIISNNGFVGEEFVLHGFYNGDVATFASLVQKSFHTSFLVTENPFSANGPLEYPTLLHGGVADFFSLLGMEEVKGWLHYLGIMTYVQILFTIPLFFLIWDTVHPEPKNPGEKWFGIVYRHKVYFYQLILTLIAIALSIDSFVYPQSHFFLIAMFLGCFALLIKTSTLGVKEQLLPGISGLLLALLLLSANTVTGTVAAALVGVLCLIRIFDKKRTVPERAFFLLGGFLLLIAIKYTSDGRTAFTNPHFSVSSAMDMIRTGLPAVFILGASLYSLSRKQYIAVSAGIVSLLGFIVFLLSDRNIVTENASRFLYHSFLIGFVLLLPLSIQLLYWIKRELFHTTRPMSERIAGWAMAVSVFAIFLLPIGISAGNTYKSLLGSDEHRITQNMKIALWWIEDHVPAKDVVITNPNEPFIVPFFTGRAMLRAKDYWLSQDDDIAKNLERAYSGDRTAQQEILAMGSFLLLSKEDASVWNVAGLKKVVDSGDVIVYATR